MVAVPVRLASLVSSAAHSRTWTTDPGADENDSLNIVWIESITMTCGDSKPICSTIDFDPVKGPHFNAEVGKGSGRSKHAFTFPGTEETALAHFSRRRGS